MLQKAQDKLKAADSDQNGAISFAEAEGAAQESGRSGDMLNKMFNKMDSNGDGELSQQEQEQMFAKMEERMAMMKSSLSPSGINQGNFNSFQNLLDSLTDDDGDKASSNAAMNESNSMLNKDDDETVSPVDILAWIGDLSTIFRT